MITQTRLLSPISRAYGALDGYVIRRCAEGR